MRRFEVKEGSSSKFWEVRTEGKTLTVRFGRIGTNGQTQAKVLASPDAALREHDKLVAEKQKKGYREVTGEQGAATPPSPLATGVVGSLLELGEAMLQRVTHAPTTTVWTGRLVFPAGGAAKWRTRKLKGRDERVGELLDRLREVADRGERWLDVKVHDDVVELQAWDWRDWRGDREPHDTLGLALEAAAPLLPKGVVTEFCAPRGGAVSITTRTFTGKKLVVEDNEDDEEGKALVDDAQARAALAAVSPGFDAWLAKHPNTRERIEHSGCSGYIDRAGRMIVAPRFSRADDFSDGLAVVYDGWKAHLVDADGRLLPGFWQGAHAFLRGLAPVAVGDTDHWGYADASGNVKIAPKFANAEPFHAPLAMVRHVHRGSGRWITTDGQLVGDPFGWFPYESRFSDGRAWTFMPEDTSKGAACVDEQGRPAIARRFYNVKPFSEGLAAVVELGSTKWGYIDRAGEVVIPPRFDEAHPFAEGRAVVRVDGKDRLIDAEGTFVGGAFESNGWCSNASSEGMINISGKGGIGFLTKDGDIAISPRFEQAYGFFEGRAYVAVRATHKGAAVGELRWGHIDRTGEYVVAPTLAWTNRFWDGVAPVQVGASFGFIDTAGRTVIAPEYKKVQARFTCGRAWVQLP